MIRLQTPIRQAMRALSLLSLLAFGGQALAEACTYREALMALEQGNTLRGMALLRMASRDGDLRAALHLASLQAAQERPASPLPRVAVQTLDRR